MTFGCPAVEQRVTGGRLGLAHQPEFFCRGIAFGALALNQLTLAVEAIEFGEVQLRIIVTTEGFPLAALGQPAQPAQFHPVGLGQVAMGGEEFFDLGIAGGFQTRGQLVVGQVRR
ncbi:hypothetical protein D3C76_1113880 [compost metagenome]